MNATTDILRGELERLFDLDELKTLSGELLGLDPERVGGTDGKGAFARALVEACKSEDALLALADAVLLSKPGVDAKVEKLFDAQPGEELKAGAEIVGVRILKKLGEGGVGVVYLAEKKADGPEKPRVALKVLRPVHTRDRSAARRFLTVARIHKGLVSKSLAPVLDTGVLPDGRLYVMTEFVNGQSLSQRIGRTGPMHYNELRPIVRGVLEALAMLHARGLVHGDVKAENVFMVRPTATDKMTNEPTGVLVDPGTDRLFSRSPVGATQGGLHPVFGTAKAIAPELARGGRANASTDLYALGCLVYEALTGRPPFVGATGIDVVAQHLVTAADPPSTHAPRGWVAKELDAIVLRSLAKDAKDRFADADSFKEAIESIGRASIPPEAREKKPLDEEAFDAATAELLENPGDEERAIALERIVEPAMAWDKAAEVLAMAAEDAEPAAKKALLFRVARIREQDLADAAGAEEAYRQILAVDAEDAIARAALEELKRSTGDSEGLVELLLEKVEGEESAVERAAVLREIATTYETKLKDRENAFVAWVQALSEEPRDETSIEAVERLAGDSTENWNEAIHALNETLESIEDEAQKPQLYVLLGRWYAEKLARPDFAIPCFGQALAIDPANDAAMEGTIALYRKAQSWQELVTMLVQRADATTSPLKARDWRAEAAQIVDKRMGDAAAAAAMYESILKEDPGHPAATEALEHIYADKKDWRSLVKLLETKAKGQRGDERLATLCAIAELYEDRLSDDDQAAAHYEAALKHDERHVVALKGLERIYSRTERYPELLANLDKQLGATPTPRQRISILERMAGLHLEEFMDHEKAEHCLAKIVEIEPGHEGANVMLVGVYRKLQRFDDLAKTLERHALGNEDDRRKIELLLQAAKVLMVDVGAPDRALKIVERVTAIDEHHTEALELSSRLQAQTGDAAKALEATERLALAENDPAKKADLYVRAARILEDKGDKDGAIERYKRALDAQHDHTKAAAALRSIYSGRGDAHGAAELLVREIEVTDGKISKAKLYAELGALQRDRLEDGVRARISFEKALELDATCTPAARGLGEMAFDKGDFAEAARYYEPLLARTSEMPADVARDVSVRCGDAFRKLELYDKAQRAYLNAKAFAADDREVLERVAEVTFDMGSPDEAAELYRDLIKQFGRDLVGQDKGRVLWRFGESLRKAGELGEAKLHLNEAADLMPDDPAPLRSLKELFASQGKWEDVVRTLRRRMESAPDDERYTLLVETGDVLMNEIGDKAKASKSYVAALELRADDRNLLTKLMAVYSESKDWSRLVEVILRIAELVDDSRQLAKYYHTAAAICHFELNRLDEAADYYAQALEHEPTSAKSFDGLVTALNGQGDWNRLEEVFRDRLKGFAANAPEKDRAHLYDQLGELLLHRLERSGDATEAFEEAQKLDPGNRQRSETLATVYGAEPKRYFQKAVKVHGDLLAHNPYRIESYQALRKLYTEAKKPDESWCACQALTVLKNAEPDEEGFYKKHRTREPAAATSAFTSEMWGKHILHPTQDLLLTDIFATITRAVVATRAQDLGKFGVSAGDKREAATDEADLARTLHYAANVTAIALPDVYYRLKDPGGLSFLFTDPSAIGLGKGALAGGPAKALAFVAGRHLSFLRPGHYLRMLVPTGSGLRAWLMAAIKTAVGQFPIPKNLKAPVAENLAAFEKQLSASDKDRLRSHVQRLLAAAPELDLKKWVAAVDLTADRVGFILSNDLELSTAMIKASPEESAGLPSKDRLKELHLYAVSEEYLTLRHKLGIAIGG